MAANVVVAWVIGAWFVSNPSIESAFISPSEVDQLINNDFESYYSEYAAGSFALKVWTNNAWVSALCIALGVLGLPVILLLLNNILNVAPHRRPDVGARPGRPVLRADPPARDARADRGVRRRGVGPADLLGVDRARAAKAARRRGPGGPRRRCPSRSGWRPCCCQRHHRGLRDAVAAADVGADRDRVRRVGRVHGLRVHRRPVGGAAWCTGDVSAVDAGRRRRPGRRPTRRRPDRPAPSEEALAFKSR